MRHKVDGRKLGRPTDHRMSLYRNLVTELLDHEKIETSEAKAKEVRSMAEQMITLGKKGDLNARKKAIAFIYEEKIADKLFKDIAPRYAERAGGYTRMTKIAPRMGDGTAMVQLELVK
jgi:large subunit ribosomal protein L17